MFPLWLQFIKCSSGNYSIKLDEMKIIYRQIFKRVSLLYRIISPNSIEYYEEAKKRTKFHESIKLSSSRKSLGSIISEKIIEDKNSGMELQRKLGNYLELQWTIENLVEGGQLIPRIRFVRFNRPPVFPHLFHGAQLLFNFIPPAFIHWHGPLRRASPSFPPFFLSWMHEAWGN